MAKKTVTEETFHKGLIVVGAVFLLLLTWTESNHLLAERNILEELQEVKELIVLQDARHDTHTHIYHDGSVVYQSDAQRP